MAASHLRLEEASEDTVNGPSNPVALFDAALHDDFRVHDDVDVDPDAVAQDLIQLLVGVNVLLKLSAAEHAPEALRAAMAVLRERPCADRELGGRVLACLLLLLGEDGVRSIKAVL